MVRPRLTIYVCQESQQLRDLQQKHEDGDAVTSTFFGEGGCPDGAGRVSGRAPSEHPLKRLCGPARRLAAMLINCRFVSAQCTTRFTWRS